MAPCILNLRAGFTLRLLLDRFISILFILLGFTRETAAEDCTWFVPQAECSRTDQLKHFEHTNIRLLSLHFSADETDYKQTDLFRGGGGGSLATVDGECAEDAPRRDALRRNRPASVSTGSTSERCAHAASADLRAPVPHTVGPRLVSA
jgi:hypothetical protein